MFSATSRWRLILFLTCFEGLLGGTGSVPLVLEVHAPSLLTSGGREVRIEGSGFRPAGSSAQGTVTVGGQPCPVLQYDSTLVSCLAPPGYGLDRPVQLTSPAGESSAPSSQARLSYAPPELLGLEPSAPATTGQTATLTGASLGVASDPGLAVSLVRPSGTAAAIANSSLVWLENHRRLVLPLPEGEGTGVSLRLTTASGSSELIFAYAAPWLDSPVAPAAGPCAGGTLLTLSGHNFGSPATSSPSSLNVTIGGKAARLHTAAGSHTHTRLVVVSPAGAGRNQLVQVRVGGQTSSASATYFSYDPPVLTSLNPTVGPTLPDPGSSFLLTLSGANFGDPAASAPLPVVTVGNRPCPITSRPSDGTLYCALPAGQGLEQAVLVELAGQTNSGQTQPKTFSYNNPVILGLKPLTGPTQGGVTLTVAGRGFGIGQPAAMVTLGALGARCAVQSSNDSHILCTLPSGQGTGVEVRVTTWPGQSALSTATSPTLLFSYDPPQVVSVSPAEGPTEGGITLTITGRNLGANSLGQSKVGIGADCTSQQGHVPCLPTGQGFKHSSVTCTLPAGLGRNLFVCVLVDARATTSASGVFSYLFPVIQSISPSRGPTAGGTLVTVSGSSFSSSAEVWFGSVLCKPSADTPVPADTKLVCVSAEGSGNVTVAVAVRSKLLASHLSPVPALWTYELPGISSLFSAAANPGSTEGGSLLSIRGSSFDRPSGAVSLGGRDCPVTSWSHTEVVCARPPGQGKGLELLLRTVRGLEARWARTVDYDSPGLANMFPSSGPTGGGYRITILGLNFGTSAAVKFGADDCTDVIQTHRNLSCVIPPGQGAVDVQLVVGGIFSNKLLFAFSPPRLDSGAPLRAPTQAGLPTLTLLGENFGVSPLVTIGGRPCLLPNGNTTYLECDIPEGEGTNQEVLLSVGGVTAERRLFFSYDAPSISEVTPTQGPTAGGPGSVITIKGSSFGLGQDEASITIGKRLCPLLSGTAWTHTQLLCVLPAGEGVGLQVTVSSAGQISQALASSSPLLFSYSPPKVTSVSPDHGPTNGGSLLNITGANFGVSAPQVTVGGQTCAVIEHTHDRLSCRVAEGSGALNRVLLSTPFYGSEATQGSAYYYNYDPPMLQSFTPNSTDTSGGTITLSGSNFGTSGEVYVGGQVSFCPSYTHNRIVCVVPVGQGVKLDVQVRVPMGGSGQVAVLPGFSYNRPSVTQLQPLLGPTTGGVPLSLIGTSLGVSGALVWVGARACLPVLSQTHHLVVCQLPAGSGQAVPVTIVVGNQTSPALSFVYEGPSVQNVVLGAQGAPTAGQVQVTVQGSNFDTAGPDSSVAIGGKPCLLPVGVPLEEAWTQSKVRCVLPQGEGKALTVRLRTSAGLITEANGVFSYDPPRISSLSLPASGVPTTGNVPLTLLGQNFGNGASSAAAVTVGGVGCPLVQGSQRHSQVVCTLPAGQGADVKVELFLAGWTSNKASLAYNPPSLLEGGLSPSSGATEGGVVLTLLGSNFGPAPVVKLGSDLDTAATCKQPVTNPSQDQLLCELPAGQGERVPVRVLAGDQISNALFFSYSPPTMLTLSPQAGNTQGGYRLTLTGRSLGYEGTVSVGGADCPVLQHDSAQVVCVAPAGEGVRKDVVLKLSPQVQSVLPAAFSYLGPSLSSLSPESGPTEALNVLLTLTGQSFGTSNAAVQVMVGGSKCAPIVSKNHSSLTCQLPQGDTGGSNVSVSVAVVTSSSTLVASNVLWFFYSLPSISLLSPLTGPTTGAQTTLTLEGSSFGTRGIVQVGGRPCTVPAASFYSHTRLTCLLPQGQGTKQPVLLTTLDINQVPVANTFSPTAFSYAAPLLDFVEPNSGPTRGGADALLTVRGSNFGLFGEVSLGLNRCVPAAAPTGPSWAGNEHDRVTCVLPPGGGRVKVTLLVAGQRSNGRDFTYSPPTLRALSPSSGPADGGFSLRLEGENLGGRELLPPLTVPPAIEVRIGPDLCLVTEANHSFISCTVPAGTGKDRPVSLSVASQRSDRTLLFSYLRPRVFSVTGCPRDLGNGTADCPTDSPSTRITIRGDGFGSAADAAQWQGSVTVAGLPCAAPLLVNHSQVSCLLPMNPAGGLALPVVVTVPAGGQASLPAPLLSYQGPRLVPNTLRLAGEAGEGQPPGQITVAQTASSAVVEMKGVFLGSNASAIQVRYGAASSDPSDFLPQFRCAVESLFSVGAALPFAAEQTLSCRLTGGVGLGLVFQLTLGLQTSLPGSDTLSYALPSIYPLTLRLPGGPVGFSRLFGTAGEGQRVVFDGENFGEFPSLLDVRYGKYVLAGQVWQAVGQEYRCLVVADESSDSSLTCQTSPGEGGPYRFRVLVQGGGVSEPGTDTYSYPIVPVVDSVVGCVESTAFNSSSAAATEAGRLLVGTKGCPSKGKVVLTIQGKYFTADNTSTVVRVGENTCPLLSFEQRSEGLDVLRCLLPTGTGQNRDVVVKVGGLFSRGSLPFLSYAPPELFTVSGCPSPAGADTADCPRDGGSPERTVLTLTGRNFGPAGDSTLVLIGGRQCEQVTHDAERPHEMLTCLLPPGVGVLLDLLLIAGQISNNSRALSYVPCEPGTFSDPSMAVGSSSNSSAVVTDLCLPCPAGSVSAGVGSTECAPCEPGFFANRSGLTSCLRCEPGSSTSTGSGQLTAGAAQCMPCRAGRFSPQTGAADCQPCLAGYFSNQRGATACKRCGIGSHAPNTGQPNCTLCPLGRFVAVTGAAECLVCLAGTSTFQAGGSICSTCKPGFFNPGGSTATGVCLPCPAGSSSPPGAAACVPCEPGRFASSAGQPSCQKCPPGFVNKIPSSDSCSGCPRGSYASSPGSLSCLPCGKGSATNETGTPKCAPCARGRFTAAEGALECVNCEPGFYALEMGSEACLPCSAGSFSLNGTSLIGCNLCSPGFFQSDARATSCESCGPGRASNVPGAVSCMPCLPGSVAPLRSTPSCEVCSPGWFGPPGHEDEPCQPCPIGKANQAQRATSCQDCQAGLFAPNEATVFCGECPPGYFNRGEGKSTCGACSPGRFSGEPGLFGCTDCEPGTFAAGNATTKCEACPVGKHQPSGGAESCKACPAGSSTENTGSLQCSPCATGKFGPGGAPCQECSPGRAQPEEGKTDCVDCVAGFFVTGLGATECSPCPPGQFSGAGKESCSACTAGKFQEEQGATTCKVCGPGRASSTPGSSECRPCAAGSYAAGNGTVQCTPCEPGLFSTFDALLGQTRCTGCPIGTYALSPGSSACLPCPVGTFTNKTNTSQCASCAGGRFGAGEGATECAVCGRGYASGTRSVSCSPCTDGSFSNRSESAACELCPAGYATRAVAATSCQICLPGEFSAASGQLTCAQCPAGLFGTEFGATRCTQCKEGSFSWAGVTNCSACPAGRFQNVKGQDKCLVCLPGTASALEGAVTCEPCSGGKFGLASGATSCDVCGPGLFASGEGALQCLTCGLGSFGDQSGQSICQLCPPGFFQDARGSTACLQCLPGRAAVAAGLDKCVECVPGRVAADTGLEDCLPCSAGRFMPLSGQRQCQECERGTSQPATGQSSCVQCPRGKVAPNKGSNECSDCSAGFVPSAGSATECATCPAGLWSRERDFTCRACAPGRFSNASGTSACWRCASGRFQSESGQQDCLPCAQGTHSEAPGAAECAECEAGRFGPEAGLQACAPCGMGRSSPGGRVVTCQDCGLGRFAAADRTEECGSCSAGTFGNVTGLSACFLCPEGRFQPAVGQTSCEPCARGLYGDSKGRVDCLECRPGLIAPVLALQSCLPCPPASSSANSSAQGAPSSRTECFPCQPGLYQNLPGSSRCRPCQVGRAGNLANSTSCSVCLPGRLSQFAGLTACSPCAVGRFTRSPETVQCEPCGLGSYKNQTGAEECDLCPSRTFQSQLGSTNCSACPPGRFSNAVGLAVCNLCPPGKFGNQSGLSGCFACAAGRFTSAPGASECGLCEAGRFGRVAGQAQCGLCEVGRYGRDLGAGDCRDCEAGEFQPSQGATGCDKCPAGSYFASAAGFQCFPCPVGKFNTAEGQTSCDMCLVGRHAPNASSTTCVACPPGRFGTGLGQAICTACPSGRFFSGLGTQVSDATNCLPCEIGHFQQLTGQTTCLLCPPGRSGLEKGLTQCLPCGAGRFANQPGQLTCSRCEAGSASEAPGAQTCALCLPGRFSETLGQAQCRLCRPGLFSASEGATSCVFCQPGRAAGSEGQVQCDACGPGKYTSDIGRAACSDCLAGRAHNLTGQRGCAPCAVGRAEAHEGQTSCAACVLGRFALSAGSLTCSLCPRGRKGDTEGLRECVLCEAGRFGPSEGGQICTPCPAKTESSTRGEVACSPCQLGFTTRDNETGSERCTPCPPGLFGDSTKVAECIQCSPGRFSAMPGSMLCLPCPSGLFSNLTGASACLGCAVGFSQPSSGALACLPCAAGKITAREATPQCLPCEAGRAQALESQTVCLPCAPGTYNDGSQESMSVACAPCPAGRQATGLATRSCGSCPAGFYQNNSGQAACLACEPGFSAPGEGRLQCQPCAPGYSANLPGQKTCAACAANLFAAQQGSVSCQLCPAGRYSLQGSLACLNCSAGRYSLPGVGCVSCPPTQVAPQAGSTSCAPCTDPMARPNPLTTSCLCAPGWYAESDEAADLAADAQALSTDSAAVSTASSSSFKCKECPVGGDCRLEGTTKDNMGALPGYWRADQLSQSGPGDRRRLAAVDSQLPANLRFYRCSRPEDCLGGENSSCLHNHHGVLCAVCTSNTYKTANGVCQACPGFGKSWAIFLLLSALVMLALLLECLWVLHEARPLFDEATRLDKKRQEGEMDDFDNSYIPASALTKHSNTPHSPPPPAPNLLYKFKIALGFIQILTNLPFVVDIPWPSKFRLFLSFLSVSNFDLVQSSRVQCVFPGDYYDKWLFFLLLPLAITLGLLVFYVLPRWYGWRTKGDFLSRQRTKRKFWRLMMFQLFLIYPSVSSAMVRLLVCKEVEGGRYLVADYSISCDSAEYYSYIYPWGLLAVLLYPLGIPLCMLYLVWPYTKVGFRGGQMRLKEPAARAMFGFLYHGFDWDRWWFEYLDMAHKLAQVSLLAFFPSAYQLRGGMMISTMHLNTLLALHPYRRASDDKLHQLAQVVLYDLYYSAYLFRELALEPGGKLWNSWKIGRQQLDDYLSFFFIALFFLFFLELVLQTWRAVRDQRGKRTVKPHELNAAEVAERERLQRRALEDRLGVGAVQMLRNPLYEGAGQQGDRKLRLSANPLNRSSQEPSSTGDESASSVMGSGQVQQQLGRKVSPVGAIKDKWASTRTERRRKSPGAVRLDEEQDDQTLARRSSDYYGRGEESGVSEEDSEDTDVEDSGSATGNFLRQQLAAKESAGKGDKQAPRARKSSLEIALRSNATSTMSVAPLDRNTLRFHHLSTNHPASEASLDIDAEALPSSPYGAPPGGGHLDLPARPSFRNPNSAPSSPSPR
eukprot:g62100.t1